MRQPSEYIAAAVRGIRDRMMAECSATLIHGADSATVTRVGTASRGEDTVTDGGPVESVRVLALASDFPGIAKDDAALLDDALHIVTSVRVDPTRASMSVGLSDALVRYAASVSGTRGQRRLSAPVSVLANDNGITTDYTDGFSPTTVHAWTVAIPREAWFDATAPEIGDELMLDGRRLRVSRVTERDGYFMLSARSRT